MMNLKKLFICIICSFFMFLAHNSAFAGSADLLKQGLAFYEKGDYAHAIPTLNKYLTNHPQNYSAVCLLGMSLCKNGNVKEAVKVFNFATEVDPYKTEAYSCLAEIFATLNKNDEAVKFYDKILTLPNLSNADKKYYKGLKDKLSKS